LNEFDIDTSLTDEFGMFNARNRITNDKYKLILQSQETNDNMNNSLPCELRKYVHSSGLVRIGGSWYLSLNASKTISISTYMLDPKFADDDKYDSEERMNIVLSLIRIASALENHNLEYEWSTEAIYWLGNELKLNPLGIRSCTKGRKATMDQKQKLIPVFRFILTGDPEGVQEYVFKQWNKIALIKDIIVVHWVFNHVKMMGFWTGALNAIQSVPTKESKLEPGIPRGADLKRLKDALNFAVVTGPNPLTKDWITDGERRCSQLATAASFSITKYNGQLVESFMLFFRDIQEHYLPEEAQIFAFFKGIFKVNFETTSFEKPTYFYRFIRHDFEMIFIRVFKVFYKFLREFKCAHLLFSWE
jgi:hypothetical protein